MRRYATSGAVELVDAEATRSMTGLSRRRLQSVLESNNLSWVAIGGKQERWVAVKALEAWMLAQLPEQRGATPPRTGAPITSDYYGGVPTPLTPVT
jgi:hypothetical protein